MKPTTPARRTPLRTPLALTALAAPSVRVAYAGRKRRSQEFGQEGFTGREPEGLIKHVQGCGLASYESGIGAAPTR